ncbi:MAG: hypothetical protein GY789_19860, partial [Hyphomicrobiales bacterium]|nr:hypothetical protein [Hyphomicrobiales bacterium]
MSMRDETIRSPAKASFQWFTILATLMVLSGCAIKLAPDYDKSIIDGLTKANEQTLILFATVSSGVSSATYAKREEAYNTQIGMFEAIAIQIKARPVPRSQIKQILGVGPRIRTSPQNLPVLEDAPSLQPVQEIVSILTR